MQGHTETIQNRGCIQTPHHLKKILVHPKDKTHKLDKTGVVYKIQCKDCSETYIGKTLRKTKLRVQHHGRKSSVSDSPMAQHIHHNKHHLDIKDTNILGQESDWVKRGIKEVIYICKERPTLNPPHHEPLVSETISGIDYNVCR